MTENVTYAPSELSPDETLTALYLLALSIARQNGSVITTGARGLGPYVFMAEARRMGAIQLQPPKEHTMESQTEPFEFISLCRPRTQNNCPEIATNVPGVIAFRDSGSPDDVVTMTKESWSDFFAAIKAGEYDDIA